MDMCGDLLHYGHMASMKRARDLGTSLLVGVVSDEGVAAYKAPPVLSLEERVKLVESVRSVDAVLPGIGTDLDEEFTAALMTRHNVTLVVHGDDPCILPSGADAYRFPKNAGIFWAIPRTPGISSTVVVRALLTNTCVPPSTLPLHVPNWEPRPNTVYVDGAFDGYTVGQVEFLRKAREYGTWLVVGLHSDDVVFARRKRRPFFTMEDRARCLLACKYVDGVIMDAPTVVTPALLRQLKASCVARGTVHETSDRERLRYELVKPKVVTVTSPSDVTMVGLRHRILRHADLYASKAFNVSHTA